MSAQTTTRTHHSRRPAAFIVLLTLVLDQASKLYFHSQYTPGERRNLLPFLDWTLAYNPGAAFSFLAQAGGWQRWFFSALALGVSAWCWHALRREPDGRVRTALALIIGGALGNLIDRLWLGKVIDFVLVYWRDWHYPAFNLADSALTLGAILILWSALIRPHRP